MNFIFYFFFKKKVPRQVGEIEAAYASSGRSQCRKCRRAIAKGALRIGEWQQSKHYDGLTVNWHHASCWCKAKKDTVHQVSDLKGLIHMRPSIQLQLCKALEIAPPDDIEADFDEKKRQKVIKQLNNKVPLTPSQTNAAVWYIKDEISELTLAQLRDLMKLNNQPVTGGELLLKHRLAYMILFGALPKCKVCKEGDLSYSTTNNLYTCHGYSSAWAKCDFECEGFHSIEREAFVSSPLNSFLAEWPKLRTYESGAWLGREAELTRANDKIKNLLASRASSQQTDNSLDNKEQTMDDETLKEAWIAFLSSTLGDRPGIVHDANDVTVAKRQWPGPPLVDSSCTIQNAKVLKCGKDDYYHALLVKVDVAKNSNSFYRLQAIEQNGRYYVWLKWGRVGTDIGQSKLQNCADEEDAKYFFENKFEEKTGCVWKDRSKFRKQARLMQLIDDTLEASQTTSKANVLSGAAANEPPSQLHPSVAALMTLLFNPVLLERQMQAMQFDMKKMPLGAISSNTISQAFGILSKLESVVQQPQPSYATIVQLSSQFYTIIPHTVPSRKEVLPMLNSKEMVRSKIRLVETMSELIALQQMSKIFGDRTKNTLDARYEALGIQITALDQNNPIFKNIQCAMSLTSFDQNLNLKAVFELKRENEQPNHACGNTKLLWHGSRLTNFVSILKQGLRTAPPHAPKTGYMYGKGVYFGDCFGTSQQYCHISKELSDGLILLNEVDLGQVLEVDEKDGKYMTNTELFFNNKHSVLAKGQSTPTSSLVIDNKNGLEAFSGPIRVTSPSSFIPYNEYVIFNVDQIRSRYLLWVEHK